MGWENTMNTRVIALIGASNHGKSELIIQVTARNLDVLAVRSLTTRVWRNPMDDVTYTFIDRADFQRRLDRGTIIQHVTYNGELYGNDQSQFDELGNLIGILAMTEEGARKLIDLGYDVRIAKVIGIGAPAREGRDDADRDRIDHLVADVTILNDFAPGGLLKATDELLTFIATTF